MRNLTWQEYFFYTRTERNAAITLIFLCIGFLVLPSFYPFIFLPGQKMDFTAFQLEIDRIRQDTAFASDKKDIAGWRRGEETPAEIELFVFDPNTTSREDFIRLGLSPRLAQTLLNYRSKGGRFYKKEDLQKIYTLRPEDYMRLEPYIQIAPLSGAGKPVSTFVENEGSFVPSGNDPESKDFRTEKFSKKERMPALVDINQATQEEWQILPGIGPGYAKRIVNFREKLGGFYSVEQVGETFGLPDSTFQQIKASLQYSPPFRKIKLNTCTMNDLKAHPYLSNLQATLIFNYRLQHGPFAGMEGVKKAAGPAFKEEDWQRIEPYLSLE